MYFYCFGKKTLSTVLPIILINNSNYHVTHLIMIKNTKIIYICTTIENIRNNKKFQKDYKIQKQYLKATKIHIMLYSLHMHIKTNTNNSDIQIKNSHFCETDIDDLRSHPWAATIEVISGTNFEPLLLYVSSCISTTLYLSSS